MIERLFLSLIATLILELSFSFLWGLRKRDLLLTAGMNILTNPLVVLWSTFTIQYGLMFSILLPELAAMATEAMLLTRLGTNVKRPVLLAICLNIFSYCTGLLILSIWRC